MTDLWLGYAEQSGRREVLMALRKIAPGSAVVFARSGEELRERFCEEEPGTVGAIIGHATDGISDMNLAAAVAHDGLASEVVLVARGATGSLRSRARQAGVTQVYDATVIPAPVRQETDGGSGGGDGGHSSEAVPGPAPTRTTRKVSVPPVPEMPSLPAAQNGLDPADGLRPYDQPTEVRPAAVVPFAKSPEDAGGSSLPTGQSEASSPILTVVSGRGGVGKTSLVAMMAGLAAGWGMEVAVVDLDLSCGNLHTCFGVAKGPDLLRIAAGGAVSAESMGRASVRCADGVHLWGPCERPEMAELVMPHVATLLSYLSTRYDLVLVDTSTTFTDAVAQAVQSCDRLLVVHDERAGAIASAARMSALAVRLGVARTRIVRVVSLGDPRVKPNAFEGRAEVGLETARMHRILDGGMEAEELLSSGKVDELVQTDSGVIAGVASLLAKTLSELGRLPDNEAARKASEYQGKRHRLQLFGKHREAV